LSIILFSIMFLIMAWLFIALLMGNAFQTFIFLIKPVSNFVPIPSYDNLMEQSIEGTHSLFREGESYIASIDNPKVASGFTELSRANKDVKLLDYLIVVFILFSFITLLYLNFRRKKSNLYN